MDQQKLADVITPVTMMMPMNSSTILQMEQYPDMLQNFPIDQCKILFEALALTNNPSLVNKSGSVGGYTALHWYIQNFYIFKRRFIYHKTKS